MNHLYELCRVIICSIVVCGIAYGQEKDPLEELKGVWQAESIETGGTLAPDEPTKLMRFTFSDKAVVIRGIFKTNAKRHANKAGCIEVAETNRHTTGN